MPDDTHRRRDIQGLRGVAVAIVVLYHARVPGFDGGFVGVDVFFVISGAVIGASLLREMDGRPAPHVGRFYARRFRRLFPAFAVCALTTMMVFALLTELGVAQVRAAKTALAATFGLANLHLLHSGSPYFGPGEQENPFLHTWSLGVEEQFYLVVPVLVALLCVLSRRTRWTRPVLIRGAMVVFAVASFAVSAVWVATDLERRAFYHPAARFWEMAIGIALAGIVVRRASTALVLGGVATIAVATLWYDESTPFPGLAATVPVVGAALALVAGPGAVRRRVLEGRWLVWLGDRSYSYYLWHWPCIVVAGLTIGTSPWVLAGAAIVAVAPAAASYRWVEAPAQRSIDISVPRRVVPLAAAAYLATAVLLVGAIAGAGRAWGLDIEARAERPDWRVSDVGCFAAPFDAARCTFNEDGARATVLLVGDSYAGAVSDGIIVGAATESVRVIVLSTNACAHLPVRVDAVGLCVGRYDELLRVAAQYRPDLVLAVHATSSYARGQFDDSGHFVLRDPAGRPFPDEAAATEHWIGAVDQAERDLAALGARLVVVDQTPAFADEVVGGQTLFSRSPASARLTRPQLDALREPVRTMVHEVLDDGSWIDPVEALCDPAGCDSRRDGVSRYFDESHLNRAGSEQLAPFFAAEIARLLDDAAP